MMAFTVGAAAAEALERQQHFFQNDRHGQKLAGAIAQRLEYGLAVVLTTDGEYRQFGDDPVPARRSIARPCFGRRREK